ncbi:MAG: hypothetical protein M3R55_07175, partial [Acidobacteriota bacterium]|nr:hypothetical protein [Acidobacteriota bacterium]
MRDLGAQPFDFCPQPAIASTFANRIGTLPRGAPPVPAAHLLLRHPAPHHACARAAATHLPARFHA